MGGGKTKNKPFGTTAEGLVGDIGAYISEERGAFGWR